MDDKMNTGNENSGHWNSGNKNLGNRNSGYRNSGDSNSGYRNLGNYNSGYRNSGHYNSGDRNSGNKNTGYRNSGDWNTGSRNSGDKNSGYYNSGDWNTGNWNSGNWNSGFFNTDEDFVRMFNKPTNLKKEDIDFPSFLYFDPVRWVNEQNATAEERIKYKDEIGICGGFLKTMEYKEAFRKAWDEAPIEERAAVKNLPNFDAKIFEEISGIDVNAEKIHLEITVKVNGEEVPFSSLSKETIEELSKKC